MVINSILIPRQPSHLTGNFSTCCKIVLMCLLANMTDSYLSHRHLYTFNEDNSVLKKLPPFAYEATFQCKEFALIESKFFFFKSSPFEEQI